MNFATYLPIPSDSLGLWTSGQKAKAIAQYKRLPHKLLDGTRVAPSLKSARNIFKAAEHGLTMPVVIQTGYRLVTTEQE